jgi:hypothetical protein
MERLLREAQADAGLLMTWPHFASRQSSRRESGDPRHLGVHRA